MATAAHAYHPLKASRNLKGIENDGPFHRLGTALERPARLRRRAMPYDDRTATFIGGDMEGITHRNYETALRRLWKAEVIAPGLGIHDASPEEVAEHNDAAAATLREIGKIRAKIDSDKFLKTIEKNYTPRQRQALAKLLSIILHGEAYALFTSASLLPVVKGTGPKLGMAMQVMEEAKHFIVMRELVKRIDRIYPQNVWDLTMLEGVLKAKPMNRLFGMNVVVESVAMNFFSTFATFPGLEDVLKMFHLDESRHSAFPQSYTKEAPLSFLERHSPLRQFGRSWMLLPLFGLLFEIEDDAKAIGIDIFEFGGKCLDKVFRLSERSGFYTTLNRKDAMRLYNVVINAYKKQTLGSAYPGFTDFTLDKTVIRDEEMKRLEEEIFGTDDKIRGYVNRALDPAKERLLNGLSGLLQLGEPAQA
jgi:hypothetical protein